MLIVDSQIHIWENETMNAHHRQVRTYSMDDALKEMTAARVDAALLQRIFDAFGPARTFWGTDITRLPCSYRECVMMFTEEMTWLQGADKEVVMGQALCNWVGWKLPG